MADLKISQLPAATALRGKEDTPIAQGSPLDTVRTTPIAVSVFTMGLPRRPFGAFGG